MLTFSSKVSIYVNIHYYIFFLLLNYKNKVPGPLSEHLCIILLISSPPRGSRRGAVGLLLHEVLLTIDDVEALHWSSQLLTCEVVDTLSSCCSVVDFNTLDCAVDSWVWTFCTNVVETEVIADEPVRTNVSILLHTDTDLTVVAQLEWEEVVIVSSTEFAILALLRVLVKWSCFCCFLLAPHIAAQDITPAVFTEELSRTFYNSLLGKDFTRSGDNWIVDQDFIPRRISTASVVIEGIIPGESPLLTTMWIALGYPPCAETFAARLGAAGGVPVELNGTTPDNHSPQCDIVKERKAQVFSIERGNGQHYLNLSKLYNNAGTGYCQQLVKKNLEMYKREYEKRNALKSQLKTTLKKSSKANSKH